MDGNADYRGKPLMIFLRRLIQKNGFIKLYESDVLDVLRYELSIETTLLEQAELNVCYSVVATAFRQWCEWPKLAHRFYELKTVNDDTYLSQVLNARYKNLKEYLQQAINSSDISTQFEVVSYDMDMSVQQNENCKSQFTKLDCTIPITDGTTRHKKSIKRNYSFPDGSLFSALIPKQLLMLNLCELSFSTIMNWWCFRLHINLSALKLTRETCHGRVESYVSSILEEDPMNTSKPMLSYNIKTASYIKDMNKIRFYELLKKIMCKSQESPHEYVINMIFYFLKRDIMEAPPYVCAPALYVKNMSKHPYNRCLHKDPYQNKDFFERDHFDYHMHQTVYPKYVVDITHFDDAPNSIALVNREFLKNVFIECKECKVRYDGVNMLKELQQHFIFCHKYEGDWQCPHCSVWFPMTTLADERWYHHCTTEPGPHDSVQLKCRANLREWNDVDML